MAVAPDFPLYSRVETVLACEIADGVLKVGDQLPTEDILIARFEVSRITIRRAIQNLIGRGLVEIRGLPADRCADYREGGGDNAQPPGRLGRVRWGAPAGWNSIASRRNPLASNACSFGGFSLA